MNLDTSFLQRCTLTLKQASQLLENHEQGSVEYDMFRSACIREFEIILELAGRLLKKCLKDFASNPREVDNLVFKDVFRKATQHDLLTLAQAKRWLLYRDNRNITAHDYGKKFAEQTKALLPQFIEDAEALEKSIANHGQRQTHD